MDLDHWKKPLRMVLLDVPILAYLTMLLGWALLSLLAGDRWWWLFLLNSVSFYVFLPLAVVLPLTLVAQRRRLLLGGALLALLCGLWWYGSLFVPHFPAEAAAHGGDTATPKLTVVSYNQFGFNPNTDAVVAVLRATDADVVALQELNPAVAEALQRDMIDRYPYQYLIPDAGVGGMGIISRVPLEPAAVGPDSIAWVGPLQRYTLEVGGQQVLLVNYHAIPPVTIGNDRGRHIRVREQQAHDLAAMAAAHGGPAVLMGDLNATMRSRAYAHLTRNLRDSWLEGGYGPGHSWHGPLSTGVGLLDRIVRIDYVLHSDHWRCEAAHVGASAAGSDHSPVVARLVLNAEF